LRAAYLVPVALVAAGLVGCGGSNGGTAGSTTSQGQAGAVRPARETPPAGGETANAGAGQPGHREAESHFEGSEKEVENAGSEAKGAEEKAVLLAERTYLTAIAAGDYPKACTVVSPSIEASLQAMVPTQAGRRNCPEILAKLVGGGAARVVRPQLEGKVVRVRIEKDHGFVIFHAPGARLYAFPMSREGGRWLVGALNAAVLAPSAATLGE
jgi:hypothetical protein